MVPMTYICTYYHVLLIMRIVYKAFPTALFALFLTAVLAGSLTAAPSINKGKLDNRAIYGYDPVAYFQQGRPVRGKRQFSWSWQGALWHFSTVANRKLFQQNPQKYAPQYGGFCAYAVSQGYTADIDPNAWEIYKGRLYLNYNRQVAATWRKKRDFYIGRANRNWPKLGGR